MSGRLSIVYVTDWDHEYRLPKGPKYSTGGRNKRKLTADQGKFVPGSRRHISAEERTWALFWRPTSLVK